MKSNLYEFYHDAELDASGKEHFPGAVFNLLYQMVDEIEELKAKVRDLDGVAENGHE